MIGIGNAISIGLRRVGGFVGLLDLFPNAAAAYSLRKLRAAYSGAAVRVRRSSDPIEQDIGFDANGELDTTALLAFVNDATPVLDDYSGAAAAYSLRKLRTAYTGSAINVRRSSDGNTQDIGFDANGDLDTTALDAFVNAEVTDDINTTTDSNADGLADGLLSSGSATTSIVTGNGHIGSAQRADYNTSGGTVQTFQITTLPPIIGQEITISFMYRSNITIEGIGNAYSTGGTAFNSIPANTGDAIRFEAKAVWSPAGGTDGRVQPMWLRNAGEFIEISDWSVTYHTADGHVVTWYDQSLSNNATQTTATEQPKIVNAGALVTENGKAAIKFDGVDDRLITSSFASTLAQPSTTFIVNNAPNNTSNNTLIDGIIGSNRHLLIANANNYTLNAGAFVNTGANSDAQSLLYTLWNGASSEFASDGGTPDIINIGTHGLTGLTIGTNFGSSNANDGNVQEIILYNSDQSGNRIGIEGNIGRYYNIDGYRDGHVVTWYDQSLSNDATQSAGANQPKIVSGGSLVTENGKAAIDFDGVGDYLTSTSLPSTFSSIDFISAFTTFRGSSNNLTVWSFSDNTSTQVARSMRNIIGQFDFQERDGSSTRVTRGGVTTTQNLASSLASISAGTTVYGNGGLADTDTTSLTAIAVNSFNIGAYDRVTGVENFWDESIQELIIFASDQSTNRTGIETNINNFYSIYP